MSELIERARALLALREKATPVDGAVFREYDHGGGRLFVEAPQRRLILDVYHEGDRDFFFSAHKMDDTIAELLAEVERLTSRLRELASAEPVAWGLEAEIDGKGWAVQLPVCPTREDAERDRQLYGHPASLRTVALIRRPEML